MGSQKSKPEEEKKDDVPAGEDDDCSCPIVQNPKKEESVCGSDLMTYASMCQFECAAKRDKTLKIKWLGPCEQELNHSHAHSHAHSHDHNRNHSHTHSHTHNEPKNVSENKLNDAKSAPKK